MVNLSKPTDSLASAVCTGHRAAIGKALSLVEGDSVAASRFCQEINCYTGQATVIGLTGPAGCGKSTLINAAIAHLRRQGLQIAVAAVDPSSAITGGAILGDRLRMTDHAQDAGVFIRSLSSRGHHGGLTRHIHRMVDVFDAAGFDVVMVETVGTGQNEQEITQITDALIVVCTGGQGDDVQALKAGILEIADVLVVNKADLIPAKTTIEQLRSGLALRQSGNREVPVIATNALSGEGIDEMLTAANTAAQGRNSTRADRRRARIRELLAQSSAELVKGKVLGDESGLITTLCDQIAMGQRSIKDCATDFLHELSS